MDTVAWVRKETRGGDRNDTGYFLLNLFIDAFGPQYICSCCYDDDEDHRDDTLYNKFPLKSVSNGRRNKIMPQREFIF